MIAAVAIAAQQEHNQMHHTSHHIQCIVFVQLLLCHTMRQTNKIVHCAFLNERKLSEFVHSVRKMHTDRYRQRIYTIVHLLLLLLSWS